MKKVTIFMLVIFSLCLHLTTLASVGQKEGLRPGGFGEEAGEGDVKWIRNEKVSPENHKGVGSIFELTGSGVMDTLSWRVLASPTVNYGLSSGDTLAQWFKPLTSCSLLAVRMMPWDFEGRVVLDIRSSNYEGNVISANYTGPHGWIGTWQNGQWVSGDHPFLDVSPLGNHITGPVDRVISPADHGTWIEIPIPATPDIGDSPFFVVFQIEKTAEEGLAAEHKGAPPYHFFKCYGAGTGPDGKHPGWFIRSYSPWVEVIVRYYEPLPPEITDVSQLPDTYGEGPHTVTANIMDDGEVVEAWLHYRVNATEDSVTMSGPGGTGGLYTGIIPIGVATVGQTVSYWVSANDNEGNRGESIIKPSFGIIAPINPDADILLVDDNVRFHFRGMMQRVLDNLGYTYEFWSITGHNGIDASVTTYGWSAAIITGWIASSVPTRGYDGTPWAAFLDGGGHLFYADQDYFYANEGTNPTPSFGPGDFAYDYFGLASGENDQYHDVYYTFFGVAGDTVSGDFTSGVEISLPTNWNWTDITVPAATAVEIFTTQDGKGAGVRYDGGTFKTVYLPWMYEALPCEAERSTLTKNAMDWFGVSAAPGHLVCSATADPMSLAPGDTVTITAHVTDDNGAFSVTAEIESPDETVMTILTLFDDGQHHDGASGDGTYGNTWTTINERVYLVDIVAVDNELNSVTYNNMAHFVATTSTLPFWGDLHGHTGFSDGIGTPEEYYLYARDVSDLDFVAIHPVNYSYLNFPTSLCSIAPNAEVPGKQYEESIQYALAQGFKIGMLNVSDTHNGTPSTGGLTAVYASGLTRGGILNGLRARHNYATTGARILLDFKIDGHTMGQAYSTDIYPEIDVNVIGTTMIQKIEVVKNNYVLYAHYGSDIAESFSYVDQ